MNNMHTQFETWYENDARLSSTTKELCRIAWENGAFCALNPTVTYNERPEAPSDPDDDFNGPLGQACQLGDETCESCQ